MTQQNKLRTRQFMGLNRSIKSCTDMRQLQTLKELVLEYHREKKQDSAELLANFLEKEQDYLDSETDAQAQRNDERNSMIHDNI